MAPFAAAGRTRARRGGGGLPTRSRRARLLGNLWYAGGAKVRLYCGSRSSTVHPATTGRYQSSSAKPIGFFQHGSPGGRACGCGRARAEPHSGLDRAAFHGGWDDTAPRSTSAACGSVRALPRGRCRLQTLSPPATWENAPLQGAGNRRTTSTFCKLTRSNGGVGIAARRRSRHLDGLVRTGDDAAGSKDRSFAQVVSRTL